MKRSRPSDEGPMGGPPKRTTGGGPPAGGGRVVGYGAQQPRMPVADRNLTTNDALSYLRDVKTKFADNKQVYDTFLEIMKEFKAQRIDTAGVIQRVKDLFKGHRELILGFNTFLPKGYEIELSDLEAEEAKQQQQQQPKQPVEFDQAISYVNKIKQRFVQNDRVYKAFLEILNMYRKGLKTIQQVYEEVAVLFHKHDDLLQEFTYFLPDSTPPAQQGPVQKRIISRSKPPAGAVGRPQPSVPVAHDNVMRNLNKRKSARRADELIRKQQGEEEGHEERKPKGNIAKEYAFFDRVKQRLRNREAYQDFLKCLNLFGQEIVTKSELHTLVADIIGRYPDLMASFNDFLNRCEMHDFDVDSKSNVRGGRDIHGKVKQVSAAEKFTQRPVSELDVSTWQRCTPSYVLLPKSYPRLTGKARQSDPLCLEVFNDLWVSVTSGSEDYSFKHFRKNQYEEALFRCEDDKYELDMAIENNASTIRAMQPLADAISKMNAEEKNNYRIPEGALWSIHYRNVQKIYGEHGAQVVDLLKKNPAVATPVILARLNQKDSEWRHVKQEMQALWAKVYDQNYHKSLDHRSFYFKQTEKKNLAAKAMLVEIREIVDRKRQEDTALQSVSAAADFSSRLSADLLYDYKDSVVHNDVYRVIKFAVDEMLPVDAADRVMDMWKSFVERFYGVQQTRQEHKLPPPSPLPEHRPTARHTSRAGKAHKAHVSDGGGEDGEGDDKSDSGGEKAMETDGGEDATMGGTVDDTASIEQMGDTADKAEGESGDEGEDMALDGMEAAESVEEGVGQQGGDEGSEGESHEEDLHQFQGCKPLAAYTGDRNNAAASNSGKQVPLPGRVFYGNDQFYILFRLHQLLYERLRTARKCIMEKDRVTFRQSSEIASTEEQGISEEEAARLHKEFMSQLFDLIDGKIEATTYEDTCRAMLGTNSYVLFTLNTLVMKVVKQLQALLADELCCKLVELYNYECARSDYSQHSDAVYHANSHVLLHDDNCFRLEARPDGFLSIQLLEPDRTEVPPGLMDSTFADYLSSLVDTPPSLEESRIFLQRNMPQGVSSTDDYPPPTQKNGGVYILNGLECKISCTTSKVSYVLDTEDVMKRMKAKRTKDDSAARAQRSKKFSDWLQTVQAEVSS